MKWKLIDTNTRREICIGDYVRTLSGELVVVREWLPPPTEDHCGTVFIHDRRGQVRETGVGTICGKCVRVE